MAAYTAAKTSDGEAAKSVENLATIQTGASSEDLAAMAAKYAEAAKVASDAAATEDDLRNAQDLQKKAEDAAVNAADYATKAETAAMAELMIVGTVKTVGGTSLDATAGSTSRTADKQTTVTGQMPEVDQPMHYGDRRHEGVERCDQTPAAEARSCGAQWQV